MALIVLSLTAGKRTAPHLRFYKSVYNYGAKLLKLSTKHIYEGRCLMKLNFSWKSTELIKKTV